MKKRVWKINTGGKGFFLIGVLSDADYFYPEDALKAGEDFWGLKKWRFGNGKSLFDSVLFVHKQELSIAFRKEKGKYEVCDVHGRLLFYSDLKHSADPVVAQE